MSVVLNSADLAVEDRVGAIHEAICAGVLPVEIRWDRPADQIDLGLSGRQIPTDTRYNPTQGPARPGVLARDSGYWAQGVSFGAQFRY